MIKVIVTIGIYMLSGFVYAATSETAPGPDPTTWIGGSASTTDSYLEVYLMSMSDGSLVTGSEVTFSNYAGATNSGPWVLADYFLWIEFESHHSSSYWGLRVITDNDDLIGTSGDRIRPFYDTDGNRYYGGMINVELDSSENVTSITDNPYNRVTLAWQVFNENEITIFKSWLWSFTLPRYIFIDSPSVADSDGDGFYEDADVATDWYQDNDDGGSWAFLGDKRDTAYPSDEVLWMSGSDYVVNYGAIAWGLGDSAVAYASHPGTETTDISDDDTDDKDGDGETDDDWDLYVYLAGRFYNTSYADEDNDGTYEKDEYFMVPAGEYKGSMYVELFYE